MSDELRITGRHGPRRVWFRRVFVECLCAISISPMVTIAICPFVLALLVIDGIHSKVVGENRQTPIFEALSIIGSLESAAFSIVFIEIMRISEYEGKVFSYLRPPGGFRGYISFVGNNLQKVFEEARV